MSRDLKATLIQIGASHPDLQPHLFPVLSHLDKKAAPLSKRKEFSIAADVEIRYTTRRTSIDAILEEIDSEHYDSLSAKTLYQAVLSAAKRAGRYNSNDPEYVQAK
jgi:hypothetical protein